MQAFLTKTAPNGAESERAMKNFKIRYRFDGYIFSEVVSADTPERAAEYYFWIACNGGANQDYTFISGEECNEIASYYMPEGWTRPESVNVAMRRSLQAAFDAAGIVYNANKLTPEIDAFLASIGYTSTEEKDPDFETVEVTYTKTHAAPVTFYKGV